MSRVFLDAKPVEFSPGATLGDLLPGHDASLSLGIIRPGQVSHSETRQFLFRTTAGEMVIETTPGGQEFGWSGIRADLPFRWDDRGLGQFRPFPCTVQSFTAPIQVRTGRCDPGMRGI